MGLAAVTVLTAYALGGLLLILAGRRGLVARPVSRAESKVAPELTPVH
jgi:hypothetical protein